MTVTVTSESFSTYNLLSEFVPNNTTMRYLGPAACLFQADHVKNLTRTRLLFTHSKKTHAPTKRRIMGCKKTPQRSRSARNSSSKVEKNRKLRSVGTGKPVSSKLWSFSPYPREGELFDQDKSTNTHSSAWRRAGACLGHGKLCASW